MAGNIVNKSCFKLKSSDTKFCVATLLLTCKDYRIASLAALPKPGKVNSPLDLTCL